MTSIPTFRLVTVNTAPERAKRLIGRVVADVKERYTIVHVANVESRCSTIQAYHWQLMSFLPGIENVQPTLEKEKPDVLVRLLAE